MAKCRPGDLAVIVQARFTCNLGKIVRVVAPHDRTGDIVFAESWGVVWWINSHSTLKWICDEKIYRRKAGPCPDSKLQPIRGERQGGDDSALSDVKQAILDAYPKLTPEELAERLKAF